MPSEVISIVVPCQDEQESLPALYDELLRVARGMQHDANNPIYFDLVLIDDGSEDNTLAIMKNLAMRSTEEMFVRYYSFSRNFGKEAALYAGLSYAVGDYVAVMDADLQDPPDLLPEMYSAVKSGQWDAAAAYRSDRTGESRIRSACARAFYRIINRLGDVEIVDGARDFRLMSRAVVNAVLELSERNRFSKGIFSWVGFKTKWIPYENRERAAGSASWSFFGLTRYALRGIVSFSTRPLMFSSAVGAILCLLAIIAIIVIIVRTIAFGDPVAGWPSMVCIVLFIGGLVLLCLGIIGQYLANVYLESKHRPLYFVRESNMQTDGRDVGTSAAPTATRDADTSTMQNDGRNFDGYDFDGPDSATPAPRNAGTSAPPVAPRNPAAPAPPAATFDPSATPR